ncbi:MAG: ubiquinol-cytochrome c reductase iron-sulfur subunit [Anaerolineaceae bacterium]|nr:ubiquinol-cytochrome c reductase iron-sulfur subunit [Anaerolineaceae bacterium]
MKKKEKMSRRDFLGILTGAIGGVIGLAIGIPAISYIIGPALKRDSMDWIRLGAVSKVEKGIPTLFKTTIKRETGWVTTEEDLSVYILTEDGRVFIAMSNICTHLGCRVRWIESDGEFLCPCHNAGFKKDGSVAFGPPPSPLDQFELKVEDDQIYIFGGGA